MIDVTAQIEQILAEQQAGKLRREQAMVALLRDVRRQTVDAILSVEADSYQATHMTANLTMIDSALTRFESGAISLLSEGVTASWSNGLDMVPGVLSRAGVSVITSHLTSPLLATAQEFGAQRIRGLRSDLMTKIRSELSLGILGQKTPWQVRQAVAGSLSSPGVFRSIEERAKVIVDLEMGRAYSQAAQLAMEQSVRSVPQMKKQWWHAGHPKQPRRSHLLLHGQIVDVDKPFLIGSIALRYPRDPKAPIRETIRCGCIAVPWHPAFGDNTLPIYDARGNEIARRGPRTGHEEELAGKFALADKK
ncbi:hypothetical protein HTZ97_16330 [Desulfuromonas acetoxidans]|uniref:Phage head morphogenesis domain-containing protein n=1 Tax=Desulfuromonas acetoxidans (strain DSM 684 / 11070) TaxID=281689 RepID=Q1K069_DESA6|nr:hypothetical protein [Desulfuromonas acetoxidans]EAT16072.1 hypothetical protein Dace_2373 [Desulfuromonas acetoxidans DSM 684]MBF0646887.1 hypothetical protein [Desulfuromonas acetoxidans]NVD26164.1 hypothetical protein [Desulfuromonas acetoxidans]NVE18024.1 hypothetical protein [Desulfuromonas acetoxidans]